MFVDEEFIHDGEKMGLYCYSTRHLKDKDKVRFYYALKGRDGKSGLVKEKNLLYLAKTVLLASSKHDTELQEFFAFWNVPITKRNVIVGKVEQRGYAVAKQ